MKKTGVRLITVLLVAVMITGIFSSCGEQNAIRGAYEAEIELFGQSWNVTYAFSGKNVEVVSKLTLFGSVTSKSTAGTYELRKSSSGDMEIYFDFEEESEFFKDGTVTFEQGESYIKIGGIRYNKVEE